MKLSAIKDRDSRVREPSRPREGEMAPADVMVSERIRADWAFVQNWCGIGRVYC
jgi:hypothetical protein